MPQFNQHKNSFKRWSKPIGVVGLAVLVWGLPSQMTQVDFRGVAETAKIKIPKKTPPFAALEDSRDEELKTDFDRSIFEDEFGAIQQQGEIETLVAGESFSTPNDQPVQLKNIEPSIQMGRLAGLVISQPKTEVLETSASIELADQVPLEPILINSDGTLKSLNSRKQLLAQHYEEQGATNEGSLSKRAKHLVDVELASRANKKEEVRFVATQSGTPIIIKKTATSKAQKVAKHILLTPKNKTTQSDTDTNVDERDRELETENLSFVLSGTLEMQGGVAYTGTDSYLRLVQVESGYVQSEGVIWATDARFEIAVDRLAGFLVAELRTNQGELLGYGEVDLLNSPTADTRSSKVSGLKLIIKPAPSGVMVEVNSARSFDEFKIQVPHARIKIDSLDRNILVDDHGVFKDESISSQSNYIVRASKAGYWGTVAVKQASDQDQVQLFPTTMIEALINLTIKNSDIEDIEKFGVVWGRVITNGKPAKDATVEMAGSDYIGPFYFSGFIPDKMLQRTSSNGLYAFVKVGKGIQTVRAHLGRHQFPAEVFPVDAKHVSNIDIQSIKKHRAEVTVFNAFNGDTINSSIQIVGTSKIHKIVKPSQNIVIPGGKGLLMIESDAGPSFEISRVTLNKRAHQIKFPMIKTKWLDSLIEQSKLYAEPDKGIVVGFNRGALKDLFLGEGEGFDRKNIIYFDSKGKIVKKDFLTAGGGFAIVNVPPGYRTITSFSQETLKTETQVFVAAAGVANIVQYFD